MKMFDTTSCGKQKHIPVMLKEVVAAVKAVTDGAGKFYIPNNISENTDFDNASLKGQNIIDGTFGNGGYTRAFLSQGANVLGLDRDPKAVLTGKKLAEVSAGQFQIVETEFSHLDKAAEEAEFTPVDAIVLDIGVSSMQIDQGERGFSFQKNGPLDMRMSSHGPTAAAAVNHLKINDLSRIFHFYGEERHARRIARMIERRRAEKPFLTTLDLAQAIDAMGLHRQEKNHAATRVFQALRIYINDELGELARALLAAERILPPGGRLVVVTFHSLEDRIVKRFFTNRAEEQPSSRHLPAKKLAKAVFTPLFKGAKKATKDEARDNPRARSAKLRAGQRTSIAPYATDYSIFGLPNLPPLEDLPQDTDFEGGV